MCVMFPWICANILHFTNAWKALGWSVPVWVHWMVCHSGAHLQRWGNFIKFSSFKSIFYLHSRIAAAIWHSPVAISVLCCQWQSHYSPLLTLAIPLKIKGMVALITP